MNNRLNIRITADTKEAINGVKSLSKSLEGLNKASRGTSGDFRNFQKETRKINDAFGNLMRDGNRTTKTFSRLGSSIFTLGNAIRGVFAYKLSGYLSQSTLSAMDMIETTHLFEVSMGNLAKETDNVIQQINRLTGLDIGNLRNRIGTMNLLGQTMGFTSENAQVLAMNVNQLSLDMGALFNVPYQQITEDLRSGLIGQSRTLYKYGIDVTEAAIANEALAQGITKSVRHMSQGEKMMLRHNIIVRQMAKVQGDFAQTFNTPINQLRVLQERFVTLSRTIGKLFIPVLGSLGTVVNAVVIILTRLAVAIGNLFGIDMSERVQNVKNSLGGMTEEIDTGMDELNSGLGKATKQAKELKKQMAGFDELNIIQTEPPKSGAGAGGVGGIGVDSPLGLDLELYDAQLSDILDKGRELADKLEPMFKRVLGIVKDIGIYLLGWKLAKSLVRLLAGGGIFKDVWIVLGWIKDLGFKEVAKAFSNEFALGVLAVLIGRLIDLTIHSEKFRKGVVEIANAFVSLGKKIGELLSGGFSKILNTLKDDFPRTFKLIGKAMEWLGKIADALDLDLADLLLTIAGFALLGTPFGPIILAFQALTLVVRAVGFATSDALDEVDLFADISEETTAKLKPFIENLNELDRSLYRLNFENIKIDDSIVADIKEKVSDISNSILNELDADRNESLKRLEPLKHAMSDEKFNSLLQASNDYYDKMTVRIESGEQEIIEIMELASKEGRELKEEEYQRIQEIQAEMKDVGIKHFTEMEDEYLIIMDRLKDETGRLSAEQSLAIMNDAKEARDSTIKSAEEQYNGILLEARRMKDVGAISDEEYNEILAHAKEARDESIKMANEQYDGIYKVTKEKLGETSRYIDWENLEMKSKWRVFGENIVNLGTRSWDKLTSGAKNAWKSMRETFAKVPDWFKNQFSKAWQAVKDVFSTGGKIFDGIKDGIAQTFRTIVNGIISGINRVIAVPFRAINGMLNRIRTVGILNIRPFQNLWSHNPLSIPSIPRLADGGSLNMGQLFIAREAGPELVGNFGGRTHVMNNDDIVNSVSRGVYEAVKVAIGSVGQGNSPMQIIVQVGEDTLIDRVIEGTNRESVIQGKNVIRV